MRVPVLRVDGSGAANSLLMQFQSDVLGIPIEPSAVRETTAVGVGLIWPASRWDSGRDTDELERTTGPPTRASSRAWTQPRARPSTMTGNAPCNALGRGQFEKSNPRLTVLRSSLGKKRAAGVAIGLALAGRVPGVQPLPKTRHRPRRPGSRQRARRRVLPGPSASRPSRIPPFVERWWSFSVEYLRPGGRGHDVRIPDGRPHRGVPIPPDCQGATLRRHLEGYA